ncbi:MAG TPA: molecular chaperone TorD family protein [Desulfurivibrionaceae bacterium]|jgi:TorA maturation chaperone TorD
MRDGELHAGLGLISRLFTYPDQPLGLASVPGEMEAGALLEAMHSLAPVRLQNEYVRLFINALPEVPCAPYGSVYLEGSVMGESTVRVGEIYRKYGMETTELPDHIAVESEFLAWLHGKAADDEAARQDYHYLLGHLKEWTSLFFDRVEQHDRLGCYRQSARLARTLLARIN